ncbi:MAG: sensor histidine kinase [Actinomycetota bacterium]|nr:sensor histidine kinase [Actinomycetota bacterium]
MFRTKTLAFQILAGVLGILLVTTAIGAFLFVRLTDQSLEQESERRAVAIADTVAQIPQIRSSVAARDRSGIIQTLATQVLGQTGAAYVVVIDRDGVRYSHPTAALIGQRITEPVIAMDGQNHLTIDHGALGLSANGKAPVRGSDGAVVGEVSVGILVKDVAARQRGAIGAIILYSTLALGIGIAASLLLARRMKRATFGLELSEIASLLQEREAMLHDIREGVIGFDARGRVSLINPEARRLLNLHGDPLGRQLDEVVPPGRLRALLSGEVAGVDETTLTDDFLLVVNRRPVVVGGRAVGAVVTVYDRSETELLVRELRAMTGLTSALRAQEHEYANRLHVASGLLEIGESEEAAQYLAEIAHSSGARAEDLRARIESPMLAALLVAKIAVAAEEDITLTVTQDSHLGMPEVGIPAIITVVGNLIDNSIDALRGTAGPRRIAVRLSDEQDLLIEVLDTGPGVAPDALNDLFVDGYTTKPRRGTVGRGLGLALVHRIVKRAGGSIDASTGPGARFTVVIPTRIPADVGRRR